MTHQGLRKKLFVNRDIQGKILGRLVKYLIFYHLTIWHVLFAVEFFRHRVVSVVGDVPPLGLGDLYANFALKNWGMLVISVALFPVIFRDMLHVTHQVAGPLVRFHNALRQLAAGETVEKIKLREGDLLTEFQDAFNAFLDSDRQRHGQPSNPEAKSQSSDLENSVLDEVTEVAAELHDGTRQSLPAAIR